MSADLALAADPSVLERAADPGEFIVQACERAKAWLREALEHGDIEQIAECKSQAEAVRVYTMSKQLGKDAELAATEIVRRAERGIGVAIRRGQALGEIAGRGDVGGYVGGSRSPRNEHLVRATDAAGVKNASDLAEDRAVKALSGAMGGVNALMGKAEFLRKQTGNPKAHCVAAAAVELINSGRGGRKLPSWWRSEPQTATQDA